MEMNQKTKRSLIGIIVLALLLWAGLKNIDAVWGAFLSLMGLISPFIIGAGIAFVLNIPMSLMERRLFTRERLKGKRVQKLRRPLSILMAFLILLGILALVVFLVLPELVNAVLLFARSFPTVLENFQGWAIRILGQHSEVSAIIQKLDTGGLESLNWDMISKNLFSFFRGGAAGFLNTTLNVAASVAGGVLHTVIGVVVAVYLLFQKERLGLQTRKLLYACLPEKRVDRILDIARLTQETFSHFVSGQCIEALILTAIYAVVLSILQMPYAMTIAVLIGLFSLIPVFGAIVACCLGAFLILTASPVKALIFVISCFIVQHIEGNLIYPHVVGSSIGLSPLWILAAVTIGGGAFGILGIIVMIPLFSVLYTLTGEAVNHRLSQRHIDQKKLLKR
ncbi:AI-2E family transporter [Eubacterium sp. 1001713B170207_170306_E7]|uniref:AI-2E family transporter n=1 Tax=Eubacterium sp. 1001713B170207_170306_E7 TaxID=2787097 RepID=UPI00189BA63B|nr:AI-2E family transporter [Eubacterium sp. 1001713B170207_170306_E7]